jgi:hypothetical protein
MSDRIVRQIDPIPNEEEKTQKRVSDFVNHPNLILVGDPGSGKSHLFDELARADGVSVLTARTFLNTPSFPAGAKLYIDALDERRGGRSDQATIDLIVQKLFTANAAKVRLACREHDWLGGADLAALHPYFAQKGGVYVLSLQPLSDEEQIAILTTQGVGDPKAFIREAEDRGFVDHLANPQNLKMLGELVLKQGEWPTSHKALLEQTTELLLKEHNLGRVRAGEGKYAVHEVRPPASAAAALRLISDVDGISLQEADTDPHFPSYRTITLAAPEMVLASLGRRTFRALGNELVDYSHRVNAEYVAASWLADAIRKGLPLGRVRALIAVDGIPAPELRGVHAWLTVLLPEHADILIEADPFGTLVYGDATSLALSQRVCLVKALGRLAEGDPYFRPDSNVAANVVRLCRGDLVEQFKRILRDKKAPFGLKNLILDALRAGSPPPEMQDTLLALLADKNVPYGLKYPALRAAIKIGPGATKKVAQLYKRLKTNGEDIRLRADIVSRLYAEHFGPNDIIALYNDARHSSDELMTGVLYSVGSSIPARDIFDVLDAIAAAPSSKKTDSSRRARRNEFEVHHFIDRLLKRAFEERTEDLKGTSLWQWIELRRSLRSDYNDRELESLKETLTAQPQLVRETFDAAIDSFAPPFQAWQLVRRLSVLSTPELGPQFLEWLIERISSGADSIDKRIALYEVSFYYIYGNAEKNRDHFEVLFNLADREPAFRIPLQNYTASPVEEWRAEDAKNSLKRAKERLEGRRMNLKAFQTKVEEVRQGKELGWLLWSADVYYANFSDVDSSVTPRQRLEAELGAANVPIVLEGFKALLQSGTAPTLQDVLAAENKNSYPRLWNAYVAGMDEKWLSKPDFSDLDDEILKSIIAIDLVLPISSRENNVVKRVAHDWKTQLQQQRPELFEQVYMFLARTELAGGREYVSGLYELLNNELFEARRKSITLELLRSNPNASASRLEDILHSALSSGADEELVALARTALAQPATRGESQRHLWLVTAYLLRPQEFHDALLAASRESSDIVWRLRALSSYDRNNEKRAVYPIGTAQIETIVRIAASHYANSSFPSGGWSGDENPWDASEFIRRLLDRLSIVRTPEASEALRRMISDPVLSTYIGGIKHVLANQRAVLREMTYKQPSWNEALQALSNGAPANVADLQALLMETLRDIGIRIGSGNSDLYKQFWNEDTHGRPTEPKSEESARDVLLGLLRAPLQPLGAIVEPEGHMVADKRTDITVALPKQKSILELKRDIHPELWTAPLTQLDRFYTRDPEASGYGVYGVFWYGVNRKGKVPSAGRGKKAPQTAKELKTLLQERIAAAGKNKLEVFVIDVSVPVGGSAGKRSTSKRKSKAKPKRKSKTTPNKKSKPRNPRSRPLREKVSGLKRDKRRVTVSKTRRASKKASKKR